MLKPLLITYCLAVVVSGYPNGPPENACISRLPKHGRSTPEESDPCPYHIDAANWTPGAAVNMVLYGEDDKTFTGFLVSVQHPNGSLIGSMDSELVGHNNESQVGAACAGTSLSHKDNTEKTFVIFKWKAPASLDPSTAVIVRYTVVKDFSTFWKDCNAFTLSGQEVTPTTIPPTPTTAPTTTKPPTTPTTTTQTTTPTTTAPTTTTPTTTTPTPTTPTTTSTTTTPPKMPTTTTRTTTPATTTPTTTTPTTTTPTTTTPTTTTPTTTTPTTTPTTTTQTTTTPTTVTPTTTTKPMTTTPTKTMPTTTTPTTATTLTTTTPTATPTTKPTTTTSKPTETPATSPITTTSTTTTKTTTPTIPTSTTSTAAPTTTISSTTTATTTTPTKEAAAAKEKPMKDSNTSPPKEKSLQAASGKVGMSDVKHSNSQQQWSNGPSPPNGNGGFVEVKPGPGQKEIKGPLVEGLESHARVDDMGLRHEVVSGTECRENGNRYVIVPNSGCRRFYQIGNSIQRELVCPGALLFDVRKCVCNWKANCSI